MKKEIRKKELIKTAYDLFITKGYENTSVDEIIAKAGIAKGTYYYHFESKEQMLEEVIDMMIYNGIERAKQVVNSDLKMEEKLVYTILALRVSPEEQSVQNAIHTKENIILHEKINNKIIDEATPLISSIVREGIKDGIFIMDDNVEERVRMSLILSNEMFDHTEITKESVYVFIDTLEKIYGAKKGTLSFIGNLIKEEQNEK
ncbi:MAG TPA: TetR/AcrR family transcriptional regulator [Candidatus Onthocola stercorigallinarum]|nr:TetR/AcrR family transcriptional regulator [Candidatus Onthocola stercorigallinarum]